MKIKFKKQGKFISYVDDAGLMVIKHWHAHHGRPGDTSGEVVLHYTRDEMDWELFLQLHNVTPEYVTPEL